MPSAPKRVALMLTDLDWHARALGRAFAGLGAETVPVRLSACGFDTTAPHGLQIPGFPDRLPDAVLVRAVSGGSFEEVTRRLGVLHALGALGVKVWNSAAAIERCVDKSTTSFLLARAGLPTPPSWTVEGIDAACAVVTREAKAGPLVLKPLFGSQGRGLALVRRPEDLPEPQAVGGVYYLQRFIPAERDGMYRDHRVLVCAGAVVAAMTRRAESWITNIHRGGTPERLEPDTDLAALALRAAAAVGADYAGVDLLQGADGEMRVIEVNSMPGWRGLQRVTPLAVAQRIAQALLAPD